MKHFALQSKNVIVGGKIKAACVEIKDDFIYAIHPYGETLRCEVVDYAEYVIMPGLVDAHAHGPQASSEIIPQQNWINYAGLALGVTTVHDPSNDTTEFFAASEMQKSGQIVSPRLFSTCDFSYFQMIQFR